MVAGGLLTFILAVVGMGRKSAPASQDQSTQVASNPGPASPAGFSRLLHTPAFYFVLLFLAYLAIAAFNPAWRIASDSRGWWLERITPPLGTWLPTSVEAPYQPMNAWRIFNMHLAAFSLALGLSVGLSTRRATLFVLWSFLVSTTLMALVAIVQKYTEADHVLWYFASENVHFWGSFFYRNQGVAYLNWGIVIAGVLYFYHARRSRDEAQSGGPHFLAFCLIGLIAVSVGLALSRGGILFAAVLIALFLFLVLIDFLCSASHLRTAAMVPITLILGLLLFMGLYQAGRAIDWDAIEKRFGDVEATLEDADRDARVLSSRMTWRMAQDALLTGWGAGSFRYAFPMYQKEVPELFYQYYHPKKGWTGRRFYRYAHNDVIQFLAEYGIVGSCLLLLSLLSLISGGLRFRLPSLWLLIGLVCAVAHAFLDFIFHSPSYWVVLVAGIALISRLHRLEVRRQ